MYSGCHFLTVPRVGLPGGGGGVCTLIFSHIRRLGLFVLVDTFLNFNIF